MQRVAFLGCGYMGKVILKALLETKSTSKLPVSTFSATTATAASAERLQQEFSSYGGQVKFTHNENVKIADEADVIFLTFPPNQTSTVLREAGMDKAFSKKLVISVVAGVSQEELEKNLHGASSDQIQTREGTAHIIRVIPTVAAQVGESTTLLAIDKNTLPAELKPLSEALLAPLGPVIPIQAAHFDQTMAMMAATHSLMVVALDSIIDSAAAAGVPRLDTLRVVSQSFRGYATLLNKNHDPSALKNSMLIPEGFTVNAIVNLDRQGVRAGIGDTIIKTIARTKQS